MRIRMSLGVKLDTLRGPGAPGDRLARVIFRGESHFPPHLLSLTAPAHSSHPANFAHSSCSS